jgi:carbon-monoxide dehydrogenase small subunit
VTTRAGVVHVELMVNGRPRVLEAAPQQTLLGVLRAELGLTGTKACCLVGECGACTVSLDGRIVDSCLVLAVEADGAELTTIEGLAADGVRVVTAPLHPRNRPSPHRGPHQARHCPSPHLSQPLLTDSGLAVELGLHLPREEQQKPPAVQ